MRLDEGDIADHVLLQSRGVVFEIDGEHTLLSACVKPLDAHVVCRDAIRRFFGYALTSTLPIKAFSLLTRPPAFSLVVEAGFRQNVSATFE